jgi:hypothetical protein
LKVIFDCEKRNQELTKESFFLDDWNEAHCDPRELWVSVIKTVNPEQPTGLQSGGAIDDVLLCLIAEAPSHS